MNMNPQLVGEPGVSAFLRSLLRNLGNITPMKLNYIYYDPTQDLEKLREKLVFFQGLVVDGEAKRLDDPGVDEWMDDINDLLYDLEDIFDDIKCLRNDQVSVDYSLLQKFSDDVSSRFKKILARAEKLEEKAKNLNLERVSRHGFRGGQSKVTLRTRETSWVVDISEIHGREDDGTEIVRRLLEVDGVKGKKNYDVVCIVGMGGLGKTTLAQLVFDAPEVAKHFDVKGWVCISNVFDVKRATKELIENLGGDGGDQQSLDSLQSRLKEMVENKRFLFVLDDVWSWSEWRAMKSPLSSCAKGSKILVTTRNILIAQALGNEDPYQLQQLNHEKCMEVFRDNAFGDDKGEQEKEDLAENIVRACRGVPLVAKVIGSMLQMATDIEKWRAVSENTVSWANKNDEIHPAIRFSYYDLPAYLKRCFEYLAVFPPDFKFKDIDLVSLWIADGLVEEKEGRMAEDIGDEYYNELKARSLIQQNDMMHDIVHHLATVVYKKFCYKQNSKEPPASVRHAFLVNPNAMHFEFLVEAPGLRTLIVQNFKDENVLLNTIRSCKKLRTFSMVYHGRDEKILYTEEGFIMHLMYICHRRRIPSRLTVLHSLDRMENIGGVEDAKMADLKSKKNVYSELEFEWSKPGNDEEMEVKIMEALEPHHTLESLTFSNYGGDKFPAYIMPSNVCFSNLQSLRMNGLNKICEMIDMEFVSLDRKLPQIEDDFNGDSKAKEFDYLEVRRVRSSLCVSSSIPIRQGWPALHSFPAEMFRV